MPKEHLTDPRTMTRLVIGWQRDRDIGVAVTTPAERSIFWHLLAAGEDPETPDVVSHSALIALADMMTEVIERTPGVEAASDSASEAGAKVNRGRVLLHRLDAMANTNDLGRLWFPILDRAKVNDAIRLLRRARDGAFGKDA